MLYEKTTVLNDELPWLLFKVHENTYTINSSAVNGIMKIPDTITAIPEAPEMFKGIVNVRGDVYPVLDLRILFKIKSLEKEHEEFKEMLERRKEDHKRWISELNRCIETGEKFTLAKDPHDCAFGKWFYSFETSSSVLNFHMKKIEEPHRLLHETAEKALACLKKCSDCKNDICLQRLLDTAKNEYVPEVLRLIDEAKDLFVNRYHKMIIVLTDGNEKMGIIVDEVLSVEQIEKISDKSSIQIFNNRDHIIGVARSAKIKGDIIMLDDKKIFQNRSLFDS